MSAEHKAALRSMAETWESLARLSRIPVPTRVDKLKI
jgi:hypothetical protein